MKLVEKYFDAFLYVANWGTHWFMLKVPRDLVDDEKVETACSRDRLISRMQASPIDFLRKFRLSLDKLL